MFGKVLSTAICPRYRTRNFSKNMEQSYYLLNSTKNICNKFLEIAEAPQSIALAYVYHSLLQGLMMKSKMV